MRDPPGKEMFRLTSTGGRATEGRKVRTTYSNETSVGLRLRTSDRRPTRESSTVYVVELLKFEND